MSNVNSQGLAAVPITSNLTAKEPQDIKVDSPKSSLKKKYPNSEDIITLTEKW